MSVALTEAEVSLIKGVFVTHPEVERGAVFGSRAMGRSRSNSDVDLVVWGQIPDAVLARLMTELDELPLPYLFDVQVYSALQNSPLREHIDLVAQEIYHR